MTATRLKVVAIGDAKCGKTCLYLIHVSGRDYPEEERLIPTVICESLTETEVAGEKVELWINDTRGYTGPDYETLRPLSYIATDVVLICFNIDSPDSLDNVSEKWVPEFRKECPNTPIILVGNKMDLRDDEDVKRELKKVKEEPVKKKAGEEMAKKINAFAYFECSAKTQEGVKEIFETAARAGFEYKHAKKPEEGKKCRLL